MNLFHLQVAKLNISYAKIAKKIDMKLLKTTMWRVLTKPTDEDKVRHHWPFPFPRLGMCFPDDIVRCLEGHSSVT